MAGGILNDPAYTCQATFGITNDVSMLFAIGVWAYAGGSATGGASIDDPFTLDLPAGVTFTAASQEAVPEPTLLVLMISAIAGLVCTRRRHPT